MNSILYPNDNFDDARVRRRDNQDAYHTIYDMIRHNNGANSNLLQMMIFVFPHYNTWLREKIL